MFGRFERKARDASEAASHLRAGRTLCSKPTDRAAGLVIRRDAHRGFVADVPRNKDGKTIEEALAGACGPFRPSGRFRSARIPDERIEAVADAALAAGIGLHFDAVGSPSTQPRAAPKGFSPARRGFGPRR